MTLTKIALTSLVLVCACGERRAPEAAPPVGGSGGSEATAGVGGTAGAPEPDVSGSAGSIATGSAGSIATGSAGSIATGGGGGTETVKPDPVTDTLIVHEWGTFTSVNSSAGTLMEGLWHEDEALPAFVYSRANFGQPGGPPVGTLGKGLEATYTGVTQKLETPVIYFYGAAKKDLHVRVDFPTGVISQWFPRSTSFGPALDTVKVPKSGFMEWRFDLAPTVLSTEFPIVAPENIWAPSRKVASVPVAVGAEREQFIFYRGVGAFEMPLSMTVDASDRITITNRSTDVSPAVFLLRVHPGGGAIVELGSLPGSGVMSGIPSPVAGKEHDLDVYVTDAQNKIAAALVQTGLYPDEARAMVDTWSKSYFKNEGLRILYVVPRAWTDKLLPLTMEPAPTALVRTLVGRVELLAPSEEKALLAKVTDATARSLAASTVVTEMGRLAEPKLRRTLQLATDPAVRTWTQGAINSAAVSY
jgi:hypothetical protein